MKTKVTFSEKDLTLDTNENYELANRTLNILFQNRIRTIALCSGARNAPFIHLLKSDTRFEIFHFVDERSAAFFVLGRAKGGVRAAVCCTSGTAVAELLPAVVESYYSMAPIVLLTADRPKSYRGSGAPQCIDQINIFSSYVYRVFDISTLSDLNINFAETFLNGTLQFNVCFDEPLLTNEFRLHENAVVRAEDDDQNLNSFNLTAESLNQSPHENSDLASLVSDRLQIFFSRSQFPVIILGPLSEEDYEVVTKFLVTNDFLIVAESLSGHREDKNLVGRMLLSGNSLLQGARAKKIFDGVIRIGGVPTIRYWRDLENKSLDFPILSVSRQKFSGLSIDQQMPLKMSQLAQVGEYLIEKRPKSSTSENFTECASRSQGSTQFGVKGFLEFDRQQLKKVKALLDREPLSEPAMLRSLSEELPEAGQLFLGNSLVLREWDSFAGRELNYRVMGNRGANGIDGLVSTAFGWATTSRPLWIVLGDLSALYDLNVLWLCSQLSNLHWKIVVVNNGGGRIFRPLFSDSFFENEHDLNFAHWAKMFKVDYFKIDSPKEMKKIKGNTSAIIELCPELSATDRFWKELSKIWSR